MEGEYNWIIISLQHGVAWLGHRCPFVYEKMIHEREFWHDWGYCLLKAGCYNLGNILHVFDLFYNKVRKNQKKFIFSRDG